MSILSLQNKFRTWDSVRRFSIGWSGLRTAGLMRETRLNETFEKWMRLVRLALKFGMILAAHKIGMVMQLDQFGQRSIRRRTRNDEPFFVHLFSILHVE